jgi:conjugal transfer pilus assembly protein TraF
MIFLIKNTLLKSIFNQLKIALFFLILIDSFSANAFAAPEYGLIYFYRLNCPHCQRFSPIVKDTALQNRLPVLAYRVNGITSPLFPNSVTPTQSELARFYPDGEVIVPMLFFFDGQHQKIYPLIKGETTRADVNVRLQRLFERLRLEAH